MDREAPSPIIAVDLLRFVCALLVVGYHLDVGYWQEPSQHAEALLGHHRGLNSGIVPTRIGRIGVELFFVISGLVIARSAVGLSWREFLSRRALRLAPAAWACASLSFIVLGLSGAFDARLGGEWLRSMLFWPIGEQIDGAYWTLGVECFFYLLIASCIGSIGRAARIEAVGTALGLISAALWFGYLAMPALQGVIANQTATLLLLPHGVFFGIGILLASIDAEGLSVRRAVSLAVMLIAALIEIAAHVSDVLGGDGLSVDAVAAQGVFLAGVGVLVAAPMLQTPLARWISPKRARTIGLLTYPLYLIHQDAGAVVMARLLGEGVPLRLAQGVTALAMLAIAWLVLAFAERPLRRLLARAIMPRRGPAPDNRRTAFPSTG